MPVIRTKKQCKQDSTRFWHLCMRNDTRDKCLKLSVAEGRSLCDIVQDAIDLYIASTDISKGSLCQTISFDTDESVAIARMASRTHTSQMDVVRNCVRMMLLEEDEG